MNIIWSDHLNNWFSLCHNIGQGLVKGHAHPATSLLWDVQES